MRKKIPNLPPQGCYQSYPKELTELRETDKRQDLWSCKGRNGAKSRLPVKVALIHPDLFEWGPCYLSLVFSLFFLNLSLPTTVGPIGMVMREIRSSPLALPTAVKQLVAFSEFSQFWILC